MLVIYFERDDNLSRMQNFPIKLDLSNFFCDERRCSLVLVDISWANVKDLQDHIQKLFNLVSLDYIFINSN